MMAILNYEAKSFTERRRCQLESIWIALIPAYQPTKLLLQLLDEAKSKGFQIIVVNDGSGHETDALFRQTAGYGTVLSHPGNMGNGRAIKTGLSYIQKHYPTNCIVVTMDADGQHMVSDAKRVCRAAQTHPEAPVLGNRRLKKNIPFKILFWNTVTRLVYCVSTGRKIHDTQTGLRAFHARLIPELLNIPGERYEYEMNVLLSCPRNKIPILEEEIDTIYIEGNAASHFDAVKDSCRIYREILKFSAASLTSFCLDYALYCLFSFLTAKYAKNVSIGISNIGTRIVSASVNYTINRNMVFRNSAHIGRSAASYAALAAAILAGNTALLGILVNRLGVNRYAAKIVTEITFFFAKRRDLPQYRFCRADGFSNLSGRKLWHHRRK